MALVRSALIGAVAAFGLPMVLRNLEGGFGEWVSNSSIHFQIADTWLRWNWSIFALVTLLAFIVLQWTRNR